MKFRFIVFVCILITCAKTLHSYDDEAKVIVDTLFTGLPDLLLEEIEYFNQNMYCKKVKESKEMSHFLDRLVSNHSLVNIFSQDLRKTIKYGFKVSVIRPARKTESDADGDKSLLENVGGRLYILSVDPIDSWNRQVVNSGNKYLSIGRFESGSNPEKVLYGFTTDRSIVIVSDKLALLKLAQSCYQGSSLPKERDDYVANKLSHVKDGLFHARILLRKEQIDSYLSNDEAIGRDQTSHIEESAGQMPNYEIIFDVLEGKTYKRQRVYKYSNDAVARKKYNETVQYELKKASGRLEKDDFRFEHYLEGEEVMLEIEYTESFIKKAVSNLEKKK